jgi:hypothetical protein
MKKEYLFAFLLTSFLAGSYALFTDHRWEDWYITYRASKNLALGNGLTFTPGERVYSFTSPINTLLPAFFAYLLPSNADEFAIWLYRIVNILVLSMCSVLLLKISRFLSFSKPIIVLCLGIFMFNSPIVDFTINGMEVPYVLFFLLLLIYNLLKPDGASIPLFVISFVGLMYSRPDGFVYAGCLIFSFLVFTTDFKQVDTKFPLLRKVLIAAAIGIVFYLPWIVFTWSYYGSPIPNTISAKSNLKDYDALGLAVSFLIYPVHLFKGIACCSGFFMPPYGAFGGWYKVHLLGRVIGILSLFTFLVPKLPPFIRALSLSTFLGVFYLTFVSGQGVMPWYLPTIIMQVILIICGVLHHITVKYKMRHALTFGFGFLAFNVVLLFFGAYHFRVQQRVIEFGNRKVIGQWLRTQSPTTHSTVFLECLGYIGYYSQLKMLDYPGMSSPEVVALMKGATLEEYLQYSIIIERLHPDWVVLRPLERNLVRKRKPGLLEKNYVLAKIFDVKDQIPDEWYLLGKPFMLHDATFYVYKRIGPL